MVNAGVAKEELWDGHDVTHELRDKRVLMTLHHHDLGVAKEELGFL